jgi:hypothetical protein
MRGGVREPLEVVAKAVRRSTPNSAEVALRACGGSSTLSRDLLLTPASACVEQLQRWRTGARASSAGLRQSGACGVAALLGLRCSVQLGKGVCDFECRPAYAVWCSTNAVKCFNSTLNVSSLIPELHENCRWTSTAYVHADRRRAADAVADSSVQSIWWRGIVVRRHHGEVVRGCVAAGIRGEAWVSATEKEELAFRCLVSCPATEKPKRVSEVVSRRTVTVAACWHTARLCRASPRRRTPRGRKTPR